VFLAAKANLFSPRRRQTCNICNRLSRREAAGGAAVLLHWMCQAYAPPDPDLHLQKENEIPLL